MPILKKRGATAAVIKTFVKCIREFKLPTILTLVFIIAEVFIEEKMDVMFGVVDKSKRRHAARLQSQIPHHPLRRCE